MELWIRSQDKRILQKIDNIYLDANYENKRICNYVDDYKTELGTYETKERAIEVLDEIQNILKPKYILDASSIKPDGDFYKENGAIIQKYNANAKIEELSKKYNWIFLENDITENY